MSDFPLTYRRLRSELIDNESASEAKSRIYPPLQFYTKHKPRCTALHMKLPTPWARGHKGTLSTAYTITLRIAILYCNAERRRGQPARRHPRSAIRLFAFPWHRLVSRMTNFSRTVDCTGSSGRFGGPGVVREGRRRQTNPKKGEGWGKKR